MTKSDPPLKRIRIEIYKLTNFLKTKMRENYSSGTSSQNDVEGIIDPFKIAECDQLIAQSCENCLDSIGERLAQIIQKWGAMKDMPQSPERETIAQEIFTLAHDIKDISSMCGYSLCAYFAESLRDYIAEVSLNLSGQRVIIQAHIDAMNIVHKNNLKEDGGRAAEELKRMVKIAIDKYR